MSPGQRRGALQHLTSKGLSKRAACRWSGLSRRVWHYTPRVLERDQALVRQMKIVSEMHPRFGYRRVAILAKTSFHRTW